MNNYVLGELFCGPGGLALGAIRATITDATGETHKIVHGWANDYHHDTCETYRLNISPINPSTVFCSDVRNFDIENLTKIDAFAYGFPCNDFSNVGESLGLSGEFGPLYSYGLPILNKFSPKFFVAENVGGLATAKQKDAFDLIQADLRSAGGGYNLTTHLYKSEMYGVPQRRHRIIIVGIHKSLNKYYRVPAPFLLKEEEYRTVRSALETPPIPAGATNNDPTRQSKTVVARLSHIRPGENAWNSNIPAHLRLNVKGAKLSQIYRRLHPDKPSYTVTGSGGGGTHLYHWKENRALTNRERARIQTFPDDFAFVGSKESVRRQIGMAVPPVLLQVIFEAILKTLNNIQYESIDASITGNHL